MSFGKQKRHEKCGNHKVTRWDRISKRYSANSATALKTDAVRRFIEMDFIGKHNERLLQGVDDDKVLLDPALVMDLRHKMKIPRKLPLATVANQKIVDSCIAHNLAVEQRYIDNQLNQFRLQLEKNQRRNKLNFNPRIVRDFEEKLDQDHNNLIKFNQEHNLLNMDDDVMKLNNEALMQSLESAANSIKDFYSAPIEALDEMQQFGVSLEENNDEDKEVRDMQEKLNNFQVQDRNAPDDDELLNDHSIDTLETDFNVMRIFEDVPDVKHIQTVCRTPSPLTPTDEYLQPLYEAAERHRLHLRCVRFEDEVEVHKLKRENSTCSNTSDGIDSVISDLAEEALLELQMEEEESRLREKDIEHAVEERASEVVQDAANEAEDTNGTTEEKRVLGSQEKSELGFSQESEEEQLLIVKGLELSVHLKAADKNEDEPILSTTDEDTASNHEQNLIIEQLFQAQAHTKLPTLRKYFLKWMHFTTMQKIEREQVSTKSNRVQQINAFLDKIRKEKVRLTHLAHSMKEDEAHKVGQHKPQKMQPENVQAAKKYRNKIKIQQDIIDLQRVKLERQERLIMQLKLHKLTDAVKEARQEIKDELKSVIRSGEPKAKAKARCLQLIGNMRDNDEDEFARLRGKALLMPKFLHEMQQRALERSIRHEQARQRRLQQEAEKEAQKIAAEEAKRLEDEAAKRLRIEALKEKRRMEKMAKILKERERQRYLENKKKSEEFCRRLLLRRVGMEGFKRLLQRKRENLKHAEALRSKILTRSAFTAWRDYYYKVNAAKLLKADDLSDKIVKRNAFAQWKEYISQERSQYLVASDWYDLKLSDSVFSAWAAYTQRMKLEEDVKMNQAISHHEWHLKWKVLDCWQRLPQILKLEKETEERRQRWRLKIWELLPDYTPNRDDFTLQ